jgi:hypothetical protein
LPERSEETKYIGHDGGSIGQDLNPGLPQYEAEYYLIDFNFFFSPFHVCYISDKVFNLHILSTSFRKLILHVVKQWIIGHDFLKQTMVISVQLSGAQYSYCTHASETAEAVCPSRRPQQ